MAKQQISRLRWMIVSVGVMVLLCSLPQRMASVLKAQDVPTPTPTRDWRVINEITSPQSGEAVAGLVPIQGTALIEGFQRYDIHISEAGFEAWSWVGTDDIIQRGGTLYLLNTTLYPDGFYDLRIRAVDVDGNYTESIVHDLEIRNANPPTPTPIFNEQGTPLPPPTPALVPTATPTPEYISFIPNSQGIFSPQDGEVIRGQTAIIGTVNGFPRNPFDHYELYISEAGFEAWEQLAYNATQLWQDTIYTLDTTAYPDGKYDLRLRIVYRDSNYDEYEVRKLFIANQTYVFVPTPTATPIRAGVFSPQPNANVSGIVEFVGGADTTDFDHWELAWRASGTIAWTDLVNSPDRVPLGGVLATLDLRTLPVGAYDFRLRIVEQSGRRLDYIVPQLRVLPVPAQVTPTPTPVG
ncbi:MAG: hypothetical protein KDE19_20500 [Caldilineaceae bacterium]|nr:hypothetical protein [Caldilineaceae bacterium]